MADPIIPQGFQYDRGCASKKQFMSRAKAEEMIRNMEFYGASGLVAYECRFCACWHTGHESRNWGTRAWELTAEGYE